MQSTHHPRIVAVLLPILVISFGIFYCPETEGNPIPQGAPYILMTTEEMSIDISDEYTVTMKGEYTFNLVYFPLPQNPEGPPWDFIMHFPAPPDAEDVQVLKNEEELPWWWTSEEYITTADDIIESPPLELETWPMFAWDVALDTGKVKITVIYEHDLVKLGDGRWTLLYSLGTGRYTEGWYPPIPGLPSGKPYVDVTIDVAYPPTLQPTVYSPIEGYDPTVSLHPRLSWKAHDVYPTNDFIALFYEKNRKGDVNGDLTINVIDVVVVINHILEEELLEEKERNLADCNGDETINITDVLLIVNVILKIIQECSDDSSACKPELTPHVMEYLKSFDVYLSAQDFDRFMVMVKNHNLVPTEFALEQNYPNPFNSTTSISYTLPGKERKTEDGGRITPLYVSLKIYNILGQEVRILVDEVKEPGYYTVAWNGRNNSGHEVTSGVYFYRLTAGNFTATKRMVLLK